MILLAWHNTFVVHHMYKHIISIKAFKCFHEICLEALTPAFDAAYEHWHFLICLPTRLCVLTI